MPCTEIQVMSMDSYNANGLKFWALLQVMGTDSSPTNGCWSCAPVLKVDTYSSHEVEAA